MVVTIKYIVGKQTRLQPFLSIRTAEVGWGVVKKKNPLHPVHLFKYRMIDFPTYFNVELLILRFPLLLEPPPLSHPPHFQCLSDAGRSGGSLIAFTVSTLYGLIKFTAAPHQGAHSFIEEGKYYLFMRLCSTVVLWLLSTSSQHTRHLMVDWSGWIIIINLRFIIIFNSVYFESVKTAMKGKELGKKEIRFMKLKLNLTALHLLPRTHFNVQQNWNWANLVT